MSIKTTRASFRQEVQPALDPGGLRVEASPTGLQLPHGDYRPHVSASAQVIQQAFDTIAQVGTGMARKAVLEDRAKDAALGTQRRLEAGDNANRAADTANQSVDFIKAYDRMSGSLGAAQARADIQAQYDLDPSAFVTPGQLSKLFAQRIEADLAGVESPEIRDAYLQDMVPAEVELQKKNTYQQRVLARAQLVDNYNAVLANHFDMAATDPDSTPQQVAGLIEIANEMGRVQGLSSDEINTSMVTTLGRLAEQQGRPDLLAAFKEGHPDVADPNKSIPGLYTSSKYSEAILGYEKAAERTQRQFAADQLEVRQNQTYLAIEAEPNYGNKLQLIQKGVDDHIITAEKAAELRKKAAKENDTRDLHSEIDRLFDGKDYKSATQLVADGDIKQSELNAYIDARNSQSLKMMEAGTPEQQVAALRRLVSDTVGTGMKSDVVSRVLNPTMNDPTSFADMLTLRTKLQSQGSDGYKVLDMHMTEDSKGRLATYDAALAVTADPAQAYAMAKSYGSKDAQDKARQAAAFGTADDRAVFSDNVDDVLDSFDGPWLDNFDMVGTEFAKDQIRQTAMIRFLNSGGLVDKGDTYKAMAEEFTRHNTPYKPEGMDAGVWVFNPTGIDYETLNKGLNLYSEKIRMVTGAPEGVSYWPEFQAGIGYVMREAQTGQIAYETTTAEDGTVTTRPIIAQNLQAVEQLALNADGMTKDEALSRSANRNADLANPMNRTKEAMNYRASQSLADTASGNSTVDQVKYNIGDIRNRNRQPAVAPNEATGSRSRGARGGDTGTVSFIANEENSIRKGFDQASGLWKPHVSLEGGTATLAYGHKLTPSEAASGTIKIGGKSVKVADGITESQAKQLLDQDIATARNAVKDLVKVPLNKNQRTALISLVYNAGVDSFKKSAALRALNKGDMETFRREAFGDKGWINYAGHPGGLKPRRAREEKLFFGA